MKFISSSDNFPHFSKTQAWSLIIRASFPDFLRANQTPSLNSRCNLFRNLCISATLGLAHSEWCGEKQRCTVPKGRVNKERSHSHLPCPEDIQSLKWHAGTWYKGNPTHLRFRQMTHLLSSLSVTAEFVAWGKRYGNIHPYLIGWIWCQ